MKSKQLLILGGGKGSRLGLATKKTPKPLLKLFENTTMLELLINKHSESFERISILTGHLNNKFEEHLKTYYPDKTNIEILCEDFPCGTAGPLLLHKDNLDDIFMLINSDSWFDADIADMKFLYSDKSLAQIALIRSNTANRYGKVELGEDGLIHSFKEKERRDEDNESLISLINTGSYLIKKEFINEISSMPSSLETEIFPSVASKKKLEGVVLEGKFLDIGIPQTLEFAKNNKDFFNS